MVFCTGDETLGIMGTSVRVAVLGTASSNRSRSAAVSWPVVPYTFAAGSISRIVFTTFCGRLALDWIFCGQREFLGPFLTSVGGLTFQCQILILTLGKCVVPVYGASQFGE